MRSYTLLLFSILTLIFYSEKWLCLGETAACGSTIPFNVRLFETGSFHRFNGCVPNKTITNMRVTSVVEVFEENTFVDLPLLEYLFLNDTGIRELKPGFVKNVPVLKFVSVDYNQIKIIQTGVFGGRFNKLQQLRITNNKISEIEDAAFSNFNAEFLMLSSNRLSLVGDWFGNTSIDTLYLSDNLITFLKKNSFEKIQKLKSVWLARNKIQFIEPGTFTKQIHIDLSHNLLHNINFLGEVDLVVLDISSNKISSLQLSEKSKIETITIYPNPWNCRCLHNFWKLAWKRGIEYGYHWSYRSNKTIPVCIYRDECNEHYIDSELEEEFLKNFTIYT